MGTKLKPSKPRDEQPEAALEAAANHVTYEIQMLVYSGEHIGGFHSSPMATPVGNARNMALESFLLHFRNLRAFLCPHLQTFGANDVIASDFLKKRESEDCADANLLAVDKERIDKMLAHLSYSRDTYATSADQHGWHVAAMLIQLIEQFEVFLTVLPDIYRQWFPTSEWLAHSKSTAAYCAEIASARQGNEK